MLENKSIDFIWLLLMGLTIATTLIAENADQDIWVVAVISIIIGFKGRMIVDRFMELRDANRYLRKAMRLYFYVIPGLIVLVHLFPEELARMTTLF